MAYLILIFIFVQRIGELAWSYRNTKHLRALGAKEFFRDHYKWIVFFHSLWFVLLVLMVGPEKPIRPFALIAFICLEFGRFWIFLTLGSRWTTRILRLPGEKPVVRGPYRWVRHPNYLIVCGEILVAPLIFDLWKLSLLGSLVHAILIIHRVKKENLAWQSS